MELRTKRNLSVALGNGEKDRELKGFVGKNACVSCCPQSYKSPLDSTAATNIVKNKI